MSAISMLTGIKTGKDLNIEKITTDLRMAAGRVESREFHRRHSALGSLVGAGTIDSKNNLDFKMVATLANAVASATGGATSGATGGIGGPP